MLCTISFEIQEGPFKEVFIKWLGAELQIRYGSGWMIMPHSRTAELLELTYRLILPVDLQPGNYPWPIRISALAI
jgi:hypothetical protein